MVESINSKVDLVVDATSFLGTAEYGKIMIGDKGFEFFNNRNLNKYIQIPWDEVDYVIVSLVFGGRWIPRYALRTKKNGTYSFASKNPKKVLRTIRQYIDPKRIVRSLSMWDVLKNSFARLTHRRHKA
ncbi:DUF956 family protein [Lapidilactobacillus bayanensis]|uniref:DUF956 family protein n=1 Tax=Lapidilactobacillus bayanensis TaxID=2485998 RepID=UPI000F790AC0|nr:DUF956 family protein [Lapidilactobacillus bayanensis]